MKKCTLAVVFIFAAVAHADPTFYVSPNPYPGSSSTLDLDWQSAVGGTFAEEDFENYSNGKIDGVTMAGILVDISTGTGSKGEIFKGSWGGAANGSFSGTVYGMALLNRDENNVIKGDLTFSFSTPIAGFGAWVYDNAQSSAQSFQMVVTEVGGGSFTSDVLESGNGNPHFVEGWLAATSGLGITDVSYRVLDSTTSTPVDIAFELDHIQLAPVPVPGALLLGVLGLAAVGLKLRKYA